MSKTVLTNIIRIHIRNYSAQHWNDNIVSIIQNIWLLRSNPETECLQMLGKASFYSFIAANGPDCECKSLGQTQLTRAHITKLKFKIITVSFQIA